MASGSPVGVDQIVVERRRITGLAGAQGSGGSGGQAACMAAGKRASMRAMPTRTARAPRAAPAPGAADEPAAGGLAAVALFAATGHLGLELVSNFLPIVYPILVAEAGFSFAQVGTVTLVATLGMTLPQPLFAVLLRRFDAGRLVIAAVLWCGLFYALVGLAGSYWPLLAAVGLGGLGSALFHPAGSVVAAAARSRRRGAAMSIFSVGGNAGAALSPLLLAAVIGWQGLRGTLVTIPLAAATALILLLLFRHGAVPASAGQAAAQRPPTGTTAADGARPTCGSGDASLAQPTPETDLARARSGDATHNDPVASGVGATTTASAGSTRTGVTDAAAASAANSDAHQTHGLAAPAPATAPGRHAPIAPRAPVAVDGDGTPATGTGAAVCALGLITLFAMARAWYQVSLITYLPLWVAQHDGARVGIAQVLFVLAGSLPAGAVLGGALSDRVGRWQVLLAAGLLLVPANAALLAVGPGGGPAALLLLTAAIGCLIGATYPVAIVIAQEAWPRNIGLAGGMIMGLGWLPGGIGASAVGMMADNVGLARALATQVIPLLVGVLAVGGYAVLNSRTRLGGGAKE